MLFVYCVLNTYMLRFLFLCFVVVDCLCVCVCVCVWDRFFVCFVSCVFVVLAFLFVFVRVFVCLRKRLCLC